MFVLENYKCCRFCSLKIDFQIALRQQPPQRVLFQPDTSSTRQPRQTTSNRGTPPAPMSTPHHYDTPTSAPISMTNGGYVNGVSGNVTLANYEPRQQIPSHVKPAITPANTPEYFRAKRNRVNAFAASTKGVQQKGMMLPGSEYKYSIVVEMQC